MMDCHANNSVGAIHDLLSDRVPWFAHTLNKEYMIACPVIKLTPLHIVSENGHSSIVEILIAYGANVNAVAKVYS